MIMGRPISEHWTEAVALTAHLEANPPPDDGSTAPGAAEWNGVFELEGAVIHGPITSRADAIAKLKAVNLYVAERGRRTDDAEGQAIAAVIEWMEAQ